MTETTADIPSQPLDPGGPPRDPVDPTAGDPLDAVDAQLEDLADVDPAEAVAVFADVTAKLNLEIDADTDRS